MLALKRESPLRTQKGPLKFLVRLKGKLRKKNSIMKGSLAATRLPEEKLQTSGEKHSKNQVNKFIKRSSSTYSHDFLNNTDSLPKKDLILINSFNRPERYLPWRVSN